MAALKDKVIGGFRVLLEIQAGSGSQGTVYKAVCEEDKHGLVPVGTVVALKVMPVQDEGRSQWRKLEKRTRELSNLRHPNVVRYHGCFSEQGTFNDIHVVVQEFLDGETLKDRLARMPAGLDVDEGLRIAAAAIEGLIYTNKAGIVHRDIKPGNIFLCRDGGVKLIDFEIAQQAGGTTTSTSGNLRGTFDYMAPDFTNAEFHGDVKSDVFSMGVVLHEMLSGKTPYQRLSETDSRQANFAFLSRWAHAASEGAQSPIRTSSRIRRLLAHTEDVFAKSLAPSRDERYASFSEFLADLRKVRFRNLTNGANTYQMLQFIGKGGFGEVFKARLKQTGQLVAVKHLLRAEYAERFHREAKIMKKLVSPCFVQLVDFFEMGIGGHSEAFLVMAFLDGMPGSSLRDAIKGGGGKGLDERSVYLAFMRYALGLKAMHDIGIFHRDIKPSNLYFPPEHPERASIMDLGIARDVNGTATAGQVPGTLDYMPPEVVLSDSRGDGRMDIYALGLCLFEALTGRMAYPRLPPGSSAYAAFFERAKNGTPPSFAGSAVSDDAEVLSLLRDMTDLNPSKRLGDAGVVASRIEKIFKSRFPEWQPGTGGSGAEEQEDDETLDPTVSVEPATQSTVATQLGPSGLADAIEREKAALASRRSERRRGRAFGFLAKSAAVLALVCAAGAGLYYAWPFAREYVRSRPPAGNAVQNNVPEPNAAPGPVPVPAPAPEPAPVPAPAPEPETVPFPAPAPAPAPEPAPAPAPQPVPQPAVAPGSGPAPETSVAEDKKKSDADLAQRRRQILDQCRGLMSEEPVTTRRRRLDEAALLLADATADGTFAEEQTKLLLDEIGRRAKWTVGMVTNETDVAISVVGRRVAPHAARLFVFKDGLPKEWKASAEGYEERRLPQALDGRVVVFGAKDLVMAPVAVKLPRLDRDVSCKVDGEAVGDGELKLRPGVHVCEYARPDHAPQSEKFTVEFAKPRSLPSVGKWTKSAGLAALEEAEKAVSGKKWSEARDILAKAEVSAPENVKRRSELSAKISAKIKEEQASLLARRSGEIEAKVAALSKDEPIETRRSRLDEAERLVAQGAADGVLSESRAKSMKADIAILRRRVVGKVSNATSRDVVVCGRAVPSGKTETFSFKDALPAEWKCTAAGYEDIRLPREFEGRTVTISAKDLVARPVTATLPRLSPGVVCRVDGVAVSGSLPLKPGEHVCVYERTDYEPQRIPFSAAAGRGVELPSPGDWTPGEGLRRLAAAERAAEEGDWKSVGDNLKYAAVASPENVARRDALAARSSRNMELAKKRDEMQKKVELARDLVGFEEYYEAAKNFGDAVELGYSLTDADREMLDAACRSEIERLRKQIDYCKRQIDTGRASFAHDLDQSQDKLKQMLVWRTRLLSK